MSSRRKQSSWRTLPSRYIVILVRLAVSLLAALTILFLILPGVSGNRVGYYWARVEYRGDEGTWDLGGVGSCKVGDLCGSGEQTDPPLWNSVSALLIFHLASAAIFFLTACYATVLFHFPEAASTRRQGTLIPLAGPLFPCIVMISDISVAHKLEIASEVRSVQRGSVYWLGIVCFVFSMLWAIVIEYHGLLKRIQAGEDAAEPVEEKVPDRTLGTRMADAAYSWWPWSNPGEKQGSAKSKAERGVQGKGTGKRRRDRDVSSRR